MKTFGHTPTRQLHARTILSNILQFLKESRIESTQSAIEKKLNINLADRKDVIELMKANSKLNIDKVKKTITYQPTIRGIHNRDDLLAYIVEKPFGTKVDDLEDAYNGVLDDLKVLQAESKITQEVNTDTKMTIVFPVAFVEENRADPDISKLWTDVPVPSDVSVIDDKLRQAGHDGVEPPNKRLKIAFKKEKKARAGGFRKNTKFTNVHMGAAFLDTIKPS